MSGLFIAMFVSRSGSRGQTMLIAVAKWIGTLPPTIVYGWYGGSSLILGIGLLWRFPPRRQAPPAAGLPTGYVSGSS